MNKGKNVKDPVQAAQPNEAGVAKGKKPNDEVSKSLEPSNWLHIKYLQQPDQPIIK